MRRRIVILAGHIASVCRYGELLQTNFLLQIEGRLGEVGGAAEVAPIVLVGAEGKDFFSLGGEAEVGRDDGEDAFLGEQGEKARGDDVDAREGEGLKPVCAPCL